MRSAYSSIFSPASIRPVPLKSQVTLLRAIIESEPARASDAVVSGAEPVEALARHARLCGTTAGRLRRLLRGDLDSIVAKALKEENDGALRLGRRVRGGPAPLPAP